MVKNLPANAREARDAGSISGGETAPCGQKQTKVKISNLRHILGYCKAMERNELHNNPDLINMMEEADIARFHLH